MNYGNTINIKLKNLDKPYFLVPLGDIHYGNEACDKDELDKIVDWIRSRKRVLWIGMGDYADYIGYKDSRFDPTVVDKSLSISSLGKLGCELIQKFQSIVAPIANKCIGLMYGNHEDRYQIQQEQMNLHHDLCQKLGVCDLGYSCFTRISFSYKKEVTFYDIRAHHGAGWAQSDGGVINRLVKFMNQTDSDVTLIGHLHQRVHKIKIVLSYNGEKVIEKVHFGAVTGTYLKTYADGITTYAEKRGYDPTPIGSYKIPLLPFAERTIGDIIL